MKYISNILAFCGLSALALALFSMYWGLISRLFNVVSNGLGLLQSIG